VQLVEPKSAVLSQDRQAGRPQRATEETGRVGVERRQRRLVVTWWAPPVAPGHARPHPIAQLGELCD
jgi:hypothetical protein